MSNNIELRQLKIERQREWSNIQIFMDSIVQGRTSEREKERY